MQQPTQSGPSGPAGAVAYCPLNLPHGPWTSDRKTAITSAIRNVEPKGGRSLSGSARPSLTGINTHMTPLVGQQ